MGHLGSARVVRDATHEDGLWAAYAHKFAVLDGADMSALPLQSFLRRVPDKGGVLYFDWWALAVTAATLPKSYDHDAKLHDTSPPVPASHHMQFTVDGPIDHHQRGAVFYVDPGPMNEAV